jgi:hypothetical protein
VMKLRPAIPTLFPLPEANSGNRRPTFRAQSGGTGICKGLLIRVSVVRVHVGEHFLSVANQLSSGGPDRSESVGASAFPVASRVFERRQAAFSDPTVKRGER